MEARRPAALLAVQAPLRPWLGGGRSLLPALGFHLLLALPRSDRGKTPRRTWFCAAAFFAALSAPHRDAASRRSAPIRLFPAYRHLVYLCRQRLAAFSLQS